jgi:hypothetical protein
MRTAILFPALAMALAGCAPEPAGVSTEVATRDTTVNVQATDEGDGPTVKVRLLGPFGPYSLAGGDALHLTIAGEAWPLREIEDADGPAYLAEPDVLSGDLVLDFERPHDHSARGLTAPMPPPFSLTAEGSTAGDPFAMQWSPTAIGVPIVVTLEGDCIQPFGRPLATDTGSYAVSPAELRHASTSAAATCPIRVTLARALTEQRALVPPYEGGWFYVSSSQSRTVEVAWEP